MTKVRLVFKSGHTETVRVKKMTVRKKPSQLLEIEWTDMRPRPLFLNLEDIVAIFEL